MSLRRAVTVALFIGLGTGWASQVQAADSAKTMQVLARVIGFLQNGPTGEVHVAVVDGPGADAAMAAFGGGVTVGTVTLKPTKVPVAALAASGAKVVFIPESAGAVQAAVAAATKGSKMIVVSSDTGCATAGRCALGVVSEPKVEIIMNRAVAGAANISFQSAFRPMVREL